MFSRKVKLNLIIQLVILYTLSSFRSVGGYHITTDPGKKTNLIKKFKITVK